MPPYRARVEPNTRGQLLTYAIVAVAALAIGVFAFGSNGSSEPVPVAISGPAAPESGAAEETGAILVHVAGAVRSPGLYELAPGDRVGDAVRRARGLKPGADQTAINFAATAEDGQQIVVPKRVRARGGAAVAAPDPAEALATGGSPAQGAAQKLDLATATATEIDAAVDGFGPTLAARVTEFRDQSSTGLTSVDQLSEVPGIGEARIEALRAVFEPAGPAERISRP